MDVDANIRRSGLEILVKMGAVQVSPLIAYLVYTRITEPDIELRMLIVDMLGKALQTTEEGEVTADEVRRIMIYHLGRLSPDQIIAILETSIQNPLLDSSIATIFKGCQDSENYLTEIAINRKLGLDLRKQAIHFLGKVGYVESLPHLERLIMRLESRVNGQQPLPFSQIDPTDEIELLPTLKSVYTILQAP